MKQKWAGKLYTTQKGVVLAITLLILLVVTIVGVSSMSASAIQVFLARNTQLKQVSFQNAESTVLIGETAWDNKMSTCINDVALCTANVTPSMIDSVDSIDWSAITGAGVTPYGKYMVEYLGWRAVPGEGDKKVHLYRVTGRGQGPNGQARTRIQTLFRKCTKADGVTCPS
jgi:type IV pilus assembly protein PilX